MENTYHTRPTVGLLKFLLIGISFIIGMTILGTYFLKSRQPVRQVTVKGLAEREVMANVGIWPISFRITANDLAALQPELEKQRKIISDFLHQQGFTKEEISYGIPTIADKEADAYRYNTDSRFRYVMRATITLCSNQVTSVEKALQKSDMLVAKGIVLEDRWDNRGQFLFTNLNAIKPAMIQEATLAARQAAEQFARDSGSQVGNILQATQGLFSIQDTHIPTKKHIRLVTTVQYALIDK